MPNHSEMRENIPPRFCSASARRGRSVSPGTQSLPARSRLQNPVLLPQERYDIVLLTL